MQKQRDSLAAQLISPLAVVVFYVLSVTWDATATYLTLGQELAMDGSPLMNRFTWGQAITVQIVGGLVVLVYFMLASRKQKSIWPKQQSSFGQFLRHCVKIAVFGGVKNLKLQVIYVGVGLAWFTIITAILASIITTVPLLGGPSFRHILGLAGVHDLRTAQTITTVFIGVVGLLLAHYPLYVTYLIKRGNTVEQET